ncbi:MAG: ATP-binding protein [Nodosilinea sp.]
MTANPLDDLRPLCRDEAAFDQLRQVLARRELDRRHEAQHTQRTQALEARRQAAEAASQAKSRFLAMISHELRTPLNAVLGLSALLSRQMVGPLNAKQVEYLDYIHTSGEHLLAIISDILDLSKVEAGQANLRRSEVSLPELCQSCLAMVQPRATEKGLTLVYRGASSVDTCLADERRLRQMLLNLLSNAVKFTHRGQVTLTVQHCDTYTEFTVEDTGIGIPPEQLEQIFQPFTQVDHALNRQYDGTGLGLALTRQLAQLHGGHLRVESVVGQGSQFVLRLPRSGSGDSTASTDKTVNTPLIGARGQHLVIIDTDLDHHRALVAYVRACGWRVNGCRSWAEVLLQLAVDRPRLLIVGDREARNPALTAHLQQLKSPQMSPPMKVAILRSETTVETPAIASFASLAEVDAYVDAYIDLPLTIPKLERVLLL